MPPKTSRANREISSPRQIRALISPVRQDIVDTVEAAGPCSVADLACLLGMPADGLYYHIRCLTRAGLLKAVNSKSQHGRSAVRLETATSQWVRVPSRKSCQPEGGRAAGRLHAAQCPTSIRTGFPPRCRDSLRSAAQFMGGARTRFSIAGRCAPRQCVAPTVARGVRTIQASAGDRIAARDHVCAGAGAHRAPRSSAAWRGPFIDRSLTVAAR